MKKYALTRLGRLLLGASLFASISTVNAAAQDGQWSFSAGVDYTSGDYGEDQDTTIYQVPLTVAYRGDNWAFAVTAPYVDLEGSGNIIPGAAGGNGGGGGASVGIGIGGGGVDLGITLPGQNPSPAPVPPPVPTTVNESGFGDVTMSFSFAPIRHDNGGGLTLGVGARLPTGDEERSLGAGEVIGSVGASYALPLSETFSVYAGVGYAHAFDSDEGGVFGSVGAQVKPRQASISAAASIGRNRAPPVSKTTRAPRSTRASIHPHARRSSPMFPPASPTPRRKPAPASG